MRRFLALLAATALAAPPPEFAVARPGYRYQFPRDHYAHPEFRTEWWYWTGNLRDAAGRRFGFELTFFRQAATARPVIPSGTWDPTEIYLAHLTLSDIQGRRFHHFERVNRAGPGLAGVDAARDRIWNGNWEAGLDRLRAVAETFRLDLRTTSAKPPVIHGIGGISQKAAGEGRASHYISFTRLEVTGTVHLQGREFQVEGTAWMDHEFFTHQLEPEQTGWDWMSIQLDSGTELMLFRLRRRDGSLDPFSAGTFVDLKGNARHLTAAEFRLDPVGDTKWRGLYPLRWRVEVPAIGLTLEATTPLDNQELVSQSSMTPTYWEGAMDFEGTAAGRRVTGVGYLEMTGYDKPVKLGR